MRYRMLLQSSQQVLLPTSILFLENKNLERSLHKFQETGDRITETKIEYAKFSSNVATLISVSVDQELSGSSRTEFDPMISPNLRQMVQRWRNPFLHWELPHKVECESDSTLHSFAWKQDLYLLGCWAGRTALNSQLCNHSRAFQQWQRSERLKLTARCYYFLSRCLNYFDMYTVDTSDLNLT